MTSGERGEEMIKRIKQIEHLQPECITCVLNKYITKYPEDISKSEKIDFMQGVMTLMANAEKSTAIPVIVRDIDKLRIKMFGASDDFTEIKKHFNSILMDQLSSFRSKITEAEDPLMFAIQLALAGNYIDFGALDHVDEEYLNHLILEAQTWALDEAAYLKLKQDLSKGRHLVYLTDNCGEIVMDRLLIEQIKQLYPKITVFVIVRGKDTLNDATMDDADQVGLTAMEEIAQVTGNGNDIMGTWLPEVSAEAMDIIRGADVLIAKGQANFETLRKCGLNIYYLFLCKCDLYSSMFHVPRLSGMLIHEMDIRNI